MESVNLIDLNLLLNVLIIGEKQLKVLETSMNEGTTQVEHCRLVQDTIRKAISMAHYIKSNESSSRLVTCHNNLVVSDSPGSNSGSPHSEVSERAFKEYERREMCKKRKTLPKRSQRVILSSTGANDELDDGFTWRKYGQKDILGAKHPRGYYRCTHRNTAGCLAVKQVQKCDDNPSAFDITYRGEHTCLQHKSKPNDQNQQQQLLLNFQTNLKVKTEGLDNSFSFPSTPINNFLSNSSTPENNFVATGFSSPFFSPATTTSESNYFSLSGCGVNNYVTDFTEIISATASTSDSPFGDIDNFLDIGEFDSSYGNFDLPYCFGSLE